MKKITIDRRVRADEPKDDRRKYRAAEWIVETREVGEGKDKKTAEKSKEESEEQGTRNSAGATGTRRLLNNRR